MFSLATQYVPKLKQKFNFYLIWDRQNNIVLSHSTYAQILSHCPFKYLQHLPHPSVKVSLSYFRISILSAYLRPHKASRLKMVADMVHYMVADMEVDMVADIILY